MTLNGYPHLWPDDEDCTRTALDATLAAAGLSADRGEGITMWPRTSPLFYTLKRKSTECRYGKV